MKRNFSVVTMLATIGVALALGAVMVPAALAQTDPGQVCTGEKYGAGELPVTTSDGIVITSTGDGAHFDLPDDVASAEVCVKGGSESSGGGPQYVTITEDTTVPTDGGHGLSHVSVVSVTSGGGGNGGGDNGGGGNGGGDNGGGGNGGGDNGDDEVLGERQSRSSDGGDEVLGGTTQSQPTVQGRTLPFSGVDPAPFVALAGLLAASGTTALMIARNK
jgi:hypothetical protein